MQPFPCNGIGDAVWRLAVWQSLSSVCEELICSFVNAASAAARLDRAISYPCDPCGASLVAIKGAISRMFHPCGRPLGVEALQPSLCMAAAECHLGGGFHAAGGPIRDAAGSCLGWEAPRRISLRHSQAPARPLPAALLCSCDTAVVPSGPLPPPAAPRTLQPNATAFRAIRFSRPVLPQPSPWRPSSGRSTRRLEPGSCSRSGEARCRPTESPARAPASAG